MHSLLIHVNWVRLKICQPNLIGLGRKNPPIQPMHTFKFMRDSVYVIQISQLMHLKKLYN